jgi:hypothetical protein
MKSYKQFITESKSKNSIELWHELWSRIDKKCKKYGIKDYKMNSDGSIDVYGDVRLDSLVLSKLPLKFQNVTGFFNCSYNQLTTLIGAPESVGGDFYCVNNKLTTLEGGPKSVGVTFNCNSNQLTTLSGAPESVGGGFLCNYNQLTTLEGAPESVDAFYCVNNKLTTLEGAPKSVGGDFHCNYNQLTTLSGAPAVGGDFHCNYNKLVDLKGFPEYYDGDFSYYNNPVSEILDLFVSKVGDKLGSIIDIINEYDVIRGNKVILDRLEEVYYQLGMTPPENIELTNYEVI